MEEATITPYNISLSDLEIGIECHHCGLSHRPLVVYDLGYCIRCRRRFSEMVA